ncbi:Iron-sulfur cluster assembly protein [Quillaja saponaria]|uniref:Iron-sulfur cluster assembly protein n=1 Tax=Quillaja saponaria TaxID=32244 RepID=A0AAD7KU38_QUISA|nr:Iron-sulfur cluster assembly protein [Quillaja saponaria]
MSGNLIDVKMLRLASKRILGMASRGTPSTSISASPEAQVAARFYHERVVDHYNNPRNVGSFDKNDSTVGTGLVGAPACGDVMKLQIKVDEETGKVVDARFKTFGCGSAIASSSVATEWVKGKQLDEVLTIKNTEIAKHLSLPPVKLHCSMLAEDAIKAAIKDYEANRSKATANPEAKAV